MMFQIKSKKPLNASVFQKLNVPTLRGASAQYESEVVYHNMKDEYDKLGIVFTDTDSALKEYPELFKKYFSKLVPPTDNKLAALNSAFWSGGTFIYVPKGVKVDIPLANLLPYQQRKYGTV